MSSDSKKNNFTKTCNRLSLFLKERRSLGHHNTFAFSSNQRKEEEFGTKKGLDLFPRNMEREGNVLAAENHKSFNLFPLTQNSPQITTNLRELAMETEEHKIKSPSLTIFYGGRVVVFNEFPEDKVEEIISLASKGIQTQTQTTNFPSPGNKATTTQHDQNTVCVDSCGPSDLPIARRTSLFRFIEKRKDRVASAAPYQIHNPNMEMANQNPQRLSRNLLCRQHKEKQQQLELKL